MAISLTESAATRVRTLDLAARYTLEALDIDTRIDAMIRAIGDAKREQALAVASSELRLYKDDFEVGELERAVAATGRGFEECVREMPAATGLSVKASCAPAAISSRPSCPRRFRSSNWSHR